MNLPKCSVWLSVVWCASASFSIPLAGAQPVATAQSRGEPTVTNRVGMTLQRVGPAHYERGLRRRNDFQKDHQQTPPTDDAQPVHPVIISKPFYIGRHEVTVKQFRQFVEAANYKTTAEANDAGIVGWDPSPDPDHPDAKMSFRQNAKHTWRNPGFEQQDDHPVTGVSFADAQAYCQWLSKQEGVVYRLPTEAEWECACRAGATSSFSFGDNYRGEIQRHANIGNVELERAAEDRVMQQWLVDVSRDPGDKHVFTAPVGSYQPNAWGIFDMHGNVWEWCADRYLDTAYTAYKRDGHQRFRRRAIDPLNEQPWNEFGDWRVIRGGSWFNAPVLCCSGTRALFESEDAACYLGFRVVRECDDKVAASAAATHNASEQALAQLRKQMNVMERRDGRIYLEIEQRQLTDERIKTLHQLQYAVDLTVRGPVTREQIQAIADTPRLTGFVMAGGARDLVAADFAPLARHSLEVLQITGLGDLDNDVLVHFAACPNLESIHLQGEGITDQGIVKHLPPLQRLHTFHVSSTGCTGVCLERFAGSPLTQASFGAMTDAGAERLRPFHGTMRRLTLDGSPITAKALEALGALRRLESLRADGCAMVTDEDWATLSRLRQLRDLHLRNTQAGDATLAALSPLNRIEEVNVGGALTDRGLRSLSEMISLRRLTISNADKITDAGFESFWRLQNLRSVSFEAPQVTGASWNAVAELPLLENLSMVSSRFGDVGLHALASSKSLQRLTITGQGDAPPVTDDGVAQLANLSSLKQLTLQRGPQVSDGALKSLEQSSVRVSVR